MGEQQKIVFDNIKILRLFRNLLYNNQSYRNMSTLSQSKKHWKLQNLSFLHKNSHVLLEDSTYYLFLLHFQNIFRNASDYWHSNAISTLLISAVHWYSTKLKICRKTLQCQAFLRSYFSNSKVVPNNGHAVGRATLFKWRFHPTLKN